MWLLARLPSVKRVWPVLKHNAAPVTADTSFLLGFALRSATRFFVSLVHCRISAQSAMITQSLSDKTAHALQIIALNALLGLAHNARSASSSRTKSFAS